MQVLVPTRGRPQRALEAYDSFSQTAVLDSTTMLFVVDDDDPSDYESTGLPIFRVANTAGMGAALNAAAILSEDDIVGFTGDDHRLRTPGFDRRITDANEELGGAILYGDDLLQGERLPTAVFIDRRIIQALGWMALPGATHLYFDDTWRELGQASHRYLYLPDVIVEHLHPTAGKADWDANYLRVNDQSVYNHDAAVYGEWLASGLANDVAKIEAAL